MKKLYSVCLTIILIILLVPALDAQKKRLNAVTIAVPADSIAQFIKPLLPYRIDVGENFTGAIWVKSIENIRIGDNRIFFSSQIYGKDIKYVAKIQKRKVSLILGEIDLQNNWQASFRYVESQKRIFIKPQVEYQSDEKELSQGDAVINALLMVLNDTEYEIDVNRLKPVTHEFNKKILTVDMSISDIYTKNNTLFIEVVPNPRIDDIKGNSGVEIENTKAYIKRK
jgi:hypothetical protein